MESRKRKREDDEPRIKYHVQQFGRSFERILKENSREELCEVVRKKLELDSETNLELVQVRDGVVYDLEDDEDFEAFRAAAYAYLSLDVRVSFSTDAVSQNASNTRAGASSMSSRSPTVQRGRQKKAAKKRVSIAEQDKVVQGLVSNASLDVGSDQSADGNRFNSKLIPPGEGMTTPQGKKRKRGVVKMDTVTAEGGKKKGEQTKANEPDVQAHESVASIGDEAPPRKKRKKEKQVESYKVNTSAHEGHIPPADASDTTNAKSKKSKSKKSLLDAKDSATQSHGHVAQTSDVDKSNKLPADTGKSIKKPSAKTSMSAKAIRDLALPSRLSETDNASTSVDITDVGTSTKKLSAKKKMPVIATPDSETPPRSSVYQTPSADSSASTVDSVRLAYASFFSKPPRSASELLANYYGTAPKAESRHNISGSEHAGDTAVVPTTSKSTAERKTKRKSSEVAVVENSGQEKQKVKLGNSHLRKSWVPVDPEEENPSQPSAKEPSTPESSKVSDAATLPPPLTTQSTSASRPLSSMRGRNERKPTSISKLASPCPICLAFPFHLQFQCPVIQSGADAILGRIEQLKAESGQADLISELEEWVRKDREKSKGKEVAKIDTEMTGGKASRPATCQSEHQRSPLPAWVPVVSLQTHPSEVLIESTNEGSESGGSSSSEGEDDQSKTGSSTGSSSSLDSGAGSLSINLENVDLDALMRGPVLKNPSVELSKLVDEIEEEGSNEHTEGDGVEGDLGLLEEEEEEEKPLPKRLRGMNSLRSISPETASDEDDGSESGSGLKGVAGPSSLRSSTHPEQSVEAGESIQKAPSLPIASSVSDTSDKGQQTMIVHSEVSAHPDPGPRPKRGEHHATSTNIQPSLPTPPLTTPRGLRIGDASSETTSTDSAKENVNETPLVTPPEIPSAQESTSEGLPNAESPPPPRATTPIRSNAPPSKIMPDTPRAVQRMKDRHGNLPVNTPDEEVGIVQPALESTRDIPQVTPGNAKDDTLENPQKETPRSPSQSTSPAKPVWSRTEIALAKATDNALEKTKQGESRATSQSMSSPAKSVLPRSETGAPSARSQSADDGSSVSQPAVKRGRGRPPLTDAIKAERKAIRDAEKAAKAAQKAAEKRAKEPKTMTTSRSRQSNSHVGLDKASSPVAGASVVTPAPASQWTTLQSVTTSSSAVSHSSPAIDELMSSSRSKQRRSLNKISDEASRSSPTPGRLDGIKTPRSASGSRKLDEEDVEQIVGSSEGAPAVTRPAPLFLPGASEFSQSQVVPQFAALASERTMRDVQDVGGRLQSGSSSEEDEEDGNGNGSKSTVSRLPLTSKPSFPSLSQLSFEKFKPSFLLSNVFSQGRSMEKNSAVPQPADNDSEEDEEESTDTERESHIPKDKRAGIMIGKRSKRRGLLH